jgi:hypothetical protein
VLDALLNHIFLSPEGSNRVHYLLHQILHFHRLVGLHLLNGMSIDDLTTLTYHTVHGGFVVLDALLFLFFLGGSRNHVNPEVLKLLTEVFVKGNGFIRAIKLGLLNGFVEDSEFGVTELEETTVQLLLGDVSLFFNFTIGVGVLLIEEANEGGLENIHHYDVALVGEAGLDFQLSILVEPVELSVLMLECVESLVLVNTRFHYRRDHANRRLFTGPSSVGQYLSCELNSSRVGQCSAFILRELLLEFLAHLNISEHLADFIHRVNTTLNFEFLKHFLFRFLRKERFVEETRSKELRVGLDEDISTVEAAE